MNPRILLLLPLLLVPLAFRSPTPAQKPAAPGGTWKVDAVHSAVLYRIKHLDTSWSIGRFNGISGTLDLDESKPAEAKLAIEIDPATIDTNNKAREDHLRGPDFFSVKEFPKISFASTKVAKSGDGYDVSGELSLHGQKKSISFHAQKTGSSDIAVAGGPRVGFFAETKLKRSEFGLDKYTDMIGDEVTLTLSLELSH